MRSVVRASLLDPLVRAVAVGEATARAPDDAALSIAEYLAGHFRFVRDPVGIEQLHTPRWMLEQIRETGTVAADCDDAAILTAALGEAVGLPARFVAVAFFDRRAPFSHVWAELQTPRGWLKIDPTARAQGVAAVAVSRIMVQHV